jgi:hypothetical protein
MTDIFVTKVASQWFKFALGNTKVLLHLWNTICKVANDSWRVIKDSKLHQLLENPWDCRENGMMSRLWSLSRDENGWTTFLTLRASLLDLMDFECRT